MKTIIINVAIILTVVIFYEIIHMIDLDTVKDLGSNTPFNLMSYIKDRWVSILVEIFVVGTACSIYFYNAKKD